MRRQRLGQSPLEITIIGLGTAAIGGGDWILGWGPQLDSESIATVRRAVHRGINWIDTAAVYGLGHAEAIVARALRDIPANDRPYVFTKGGFAWDDLGNVVSDLDPRTIQLQVEDSLRRLRVDVLDLYHLELPVADCPVFRRTGSAESAWDALAGLQQAGKIRLIGLTNPDPIRLTTLHRIAPVTSVQIRYSLLRRDPDHDMLPLCDALGIAVMAASPMESGLLTGALTAERVRTLPHNDWRRWCPYFQSAASVRTMRVVDELRAAGARHSSRPGAVAIAWASGQKAVTAVCAGARRPGQIEDLAAAERIRLTTREAAELKSAASDDLDAGLEEPTLSRHAARR